MERLTFFLRYVEGAIYQLKYLTERYGDELKAEINDLSHARVLTLDLEETTPPRFSYGGCDVQDGKLRILFVEQNLGTNIDYCLQENTLFAALNAAPSDKPLSFYARENIRTEYDAKIGEAKQQIAEQLGKKDDEITLNPNFADVFAKLDAASKQKGSSLREDWQKTIGDFVQRYFAALAYQMKYIKVGEDDMVQEGFLEAVSTNEFAFRVVDQLKYDSYGEVVIEDGVLYLQCKPDTFGTNIDYSCSKLMDQL